MEVSGGKKITSNDLTPMDLGYFIEQIRGDKFRETVEEIRSKDTKKERDEIKRERLPYFVPAGLFQNNKRAKKLWVKDSGIVIIDHDIYDLEEAIKLKEKLSKCPYVLAVFISPSRGLKILVLTPKGSTKPEAYLHKWKFVSGFLNDNFDVDVDESGKDPSRACFLSWDPDVSFNRDAKELEIPAHEEVQVGTHEGKTITDQMVEAKAISSHSWPLPGESTEYARERTLKYLRQIPSEEGNRGSDGLMRACRAVVDGFAIDDFSQEESISIIQEWNRTIANPPWSPEEITRAIGNVRSQPSHRERGRLNNPHKQNHTNNPMPRNSRASKSSFTKLAEAMEDFIEDAWARDAMYPRDEIIEIYEDIVGQELQPLDIVSATQLVSQNPEMNIPLIDGLVRIGETCNIIAAPKTGKSWLVLQAALSIANGEPFLGMETTKSTVLLIDNELHKSVLADRIRKVSEQSQLSNENLRTVSLRGHLESIDVLEKLVVNAVKECNAQLIIFDALYRVLPKDMNENDNAAMTQVYNTLDQIAEASGATVFVIHHTSKGSQAAKGVTDIGSGAGAISRAADSHLTIREHEEDGALVIESVTRSFPPPEPIVARKEGWLLFTDSTLDPCRIKGRSPQKILEDSRPVDPEDFPIPEIGDPRKKVDLVEELRETRNISKVHAERSISIAIEEGLVKELEGARRCLYISHPDDSIEGPRRDRVENYLAKHPDATDEEVAEATEATSSYVKRLKKKMAEDYEANQF